MNKKTVIILIIVSVLVIGGMVGTTLAVWRSRQYEENSVGKTSGYVNDSYKYFSYEAVLDEGEVIGLAVIGYKGVFPTAEIPEKAKFTANIGTYSGVEHEYDVITVSREFSDNKFIETLIVPYTVTVFEDYSCMNFLYLKEVVFKGTSDHANKFAIGNNAFAGCTYLKKMSFKLSSDGGLNYTNVTETGSTYTVRKAFFESVSNTAFAATQVFTTAQAIRAALA